MKRTAGGAGGALKVSRESFRRQKVGSRVIKVGAWSVRPMYHKLKVKKGQVQVLGEGLGKEEELCAELVRKNTGIMALSEVRWREYGEYKYSDHLILFSGVAKDHPKAERGVAIVLDREMQKAWKAAWSPVSYANERLMSCKLKMEGTTFSIISVYAPTYDSSEEDKLEFYRKLNDMMHNTPRSQTFVVMGDFNARVGVRDETWENVLGPHGNPERNDNGIKLLELCEANQCRAMGTWFQHKHYNTCDMQDGKHGTHWTT